ncbi:MAG: carbohydrate binding domain-containing protein [Acutalibacteraceae bacterium]
MKKLASLILILVLFLSMSIPASASTNQLIEYPEYPDVLPRNYDYAVSVTQGEKTINIPVYNTCRQDEIFLDDKYRRFCEFAFEGDAVTIDVTVNIDITSFEVLPSSKHIPATVSGNVISITLAEAENVVVRLNGDYNTCLTIIAEAPQTDVPSKDDESVIYCDAGLNNITNGEIVDNQIDLTNNQTLYLAPGALVTARVKVSKTSGVTADYYKVCGRGAIIDPEPNRTKNIDAEKSYLLMSEWGVSNLSISGIKLLDARTFNITLSGTTDSDITDVKILSNQISTDGISYWYGAKRITTSNCYLYVNDNVLVIGGVEDIHIEDMTIGTGYATFFPQGTCTNVTCDNVDVFRSSQLYKSTLSLSSALTQNITISNVRSTDALKLSYFVNCSNQNSGVKDVAFENISLPKTVTYWYRISDTSGTSYPTSNYSFTFNNVWRGDVQFTETDVTYDESIAKTTFSTEFDADKAMANLSVKQTASYTAEKIYAGDYMLPNFKNIPQIIDNTLYVDAVGVLEQLGYNVGFTDGLLTFNNSKDTYSLSVGEYKGYKNTFKKPLSKPFLHQNSSVLMPVTALSELKIAEYTYNKTTKTLNIEYVSTDENLLLNSDFEDGETLDWICYMFSALNEKEGKDGVGKSMLVTPHKKYLSNDTGISQYITDDLWKNGAGTYRLQADIKLNTDYMGYDYQDNNVVMGITNSAWSLRSTTSIRQAFEISDEWQTFSFDIEISESNLSKYSNAYFFIGACVNTKSLKSFYVDNVSMVKVIPENELEVDAEMVNGASIRLNEKNGIRFYTNVDTQKINELKNSGAKVEMGTLIAPADLLDEEELTFETASDKRVNVCFDSEIYFTEDDFAGIVGSIVNIRESTDENLNSGNIGRDFIGRGYVKVTKDNKSYISYASYNSSYARSLAFVANGLKNDSNQVSLYNKYKSLIDKWAGFLSA